MDTIKGKCAGCGKPLDIDPKEMTPGMLPFCSPLCAAAGPAFDICESDQGPIPVLKP
jgi:hypothetical protein